MIKLLSSIVNFLLSKIKILVIFRYGKSIGDQLCISSLTSSLKKKNKFFKIILIVNYPELFYNNKDIFLLFKFKKNKIGFFFFRFLTRFKGSSIKEFRSKYTEDGDFTYLRKIKGQHIIRAMSCEFENIIDDSEIEIQNKFVLNKSEQQKVSSKFILPNHYALVQSQGKSHYSTLKQWSLIKLQQVINNLPTIKWVQIGLDSEFKFENVIDLRSKTSLRELGYLFSQANFLLTHEGFYSHFSSCFNLKTFVIHPGISMISNFSYTNTIHIQKISNLDCYPCYLKNNCIKQKQKCMENIFANDVIDIIKKNTNF